MMTAELRQSCATIWTGIKKSKNIARLNSSIKCPDDNKASYEASEEDLSSELAASIAESTALCPFVDNVQAELVDLREEVAAKDVVIRSIVDDLYVSLGQSLRSFVEKFRTGRNKSVSLVFRAGSIPSQFHAIAAIDGTTLRFSKGAALEDGDDSTKGKDVIDPRVDREVIKL